MNTKRVMAGAIVWSIGLLIPLMYHALLIYAAVQEDGYRYSFQSITKYFFDLPWIVWPYLIAMTIVGLALVMSGLRGNKPE